MAPHPRMGSGFGVPAGQARISIAAPVYSPHRHASMSTRHWFSGAKFMGPLAQGDGAGRVLGARVRSAAKCEVDLLLLLRADDAYRLRTVTIPLDRLDDMRNHLFKDIPPEHLRSEEVKISTLEDAMRSARTLAEGAAAEPTLGREQWLPEVQFVEALTRSHLRSDIPGLPQPLPWWDITRKGVGVAGGCRRPGRGARTAQVIGRRRLCRWAVGRGLRR
jgi:hypothetical protein